MIISDLQPGDKVTYITSHSAPERGIVKHLSGNDHAFVVYHCDNNWDRYEDYTSARTRIEDLILGWL